jgi:hypothetical protein
MSLNLSLPGIVVIRQRSRHIAGGGVMNRSPFTRARDFVRAGRAAAMSSAANDF